MYSWPVSYFEGCSICHEAVVIVAVIVVVVVVAAIVVLDTTASHYNNNSNAISAADSCRNHSLRVCCHNRHTNNHCKNSN